LAWKYTNYVTPLATHMAWKCIWRRENSVRYKTWGLHTQNLIGKQKDDVTNCIWIIFSPLLSYLVT
jgi:hypothetical protein